MTLAVGEHVRMPRTYRGRDIFWWMESAGVLDERHDQVDDIVRARHVASPQLIGRRGSAIDLDSLRAEGVRVVGRLGAINDGRAQFSGSLPNLTKLADLKLNRLLDGFDEHARTAGLEDSVGPVERFAPTRDRDPLLSLDLGSGAIGTVVWATGYRPDFSWLELPILDRFGYLVTTAAS